MGTKAGDPKVGDLVRIAPEPMGYPIPSRRIDLKDLNVAEEEEYDTSEDEVLGVGMVVEQIEEQAILREDGAEYLERIRIVKVFWR